MKFLALSFLVISLLFPRSVFSGLVMVSNPEAQGGGSDEMGADGYPVSRFGQPPSNPVRFQADRLDHTMSANRTPAGLKYEDEMSVDQTQANRANPEALRESLARELPHTPQSSLRESSPASLIPNGQKGIQEVSLIVGELGYFPKTFFVTRDVPVRLFITGASKQSQCFMMDSFQVRKNVALEKIEEVTFTPSQPGQYRFYCPKTGSEGTMVVRDLASE